MVTYDLGYKTHIIVNTKSDMPISVVVASTNDNKKKHAPTLLGKVAGIPCKVKVVVADSQ